MPLFRRLALLAIVAAGFAVLSGPASAAYLRDASLPFTLDSRNFTVHYQSTFGSSSAITQTQAGDIGALADRALAAEMADGYPRPLSDAPLYSPDDKIDIYVEDYSSFPGVLAAAYWDTDALQSSGFIELAGNLQEDAFNQHVIAHELFHLIQFSMWLPPALWGPTSLSDAWLLEASAEWMGFRVDGYPAPTGLGPPDMALDCRDPYGTNQCDLTDDYFNDGYSRWPFFEFLSEKYGPAFVKDIFGKGISGGPAATALTSLTAALVAKGTTLEATYNAWSLAELTSNYSIAQLKTQRPQPYNVTPIFTGVGTAPVISTKVAVNHLSTRFLEFDRGPATGGTTATTCWQATLKLTVTFPTNTLSQPVFYWDGPTPLATPLSVNGGTATASVPWDTCTWTDGEGFLSLPNASSTSSTSSTNFDAADFDVKAELVLSSPLVQVTSVVPATPPPGVVVTTPIIPVSTLDVSPTISVFGPELLTLGADDSQLRLIVSSTGQGKLSASLGVRVLGTVNLRAGSNDVRFTIPKGTLATVRRSSIASNVLTLTPTSLNGSSTGAPVKRTISVEPETGTQTKTTFAKPTLKQKAAAKKAAAKKLAAKKKLSATKHGK